MATSTLTHAARFVPALPSAVAVAERVGPITGRSLIASLFVLSAVSKVQAYEATQSYMATFGLPGTLLPLVILFEIVMPLLLIAGPAVRLAATALAGFSIASAVLFHADLADPNQMTHLLKNLAVAGGLLTIAARPRG